MMLEPEMERAMTWSEILGPVFLLLFPAIGLLVFLAVSRRGLARAARNPDPIVVAVEKAIRQPRRLILHTRLPGAERVKVDSFAQGEEPLVVPAPPGAPEGQQWVLALRAPGGKHYVLDSRLAWLDLTEDERSRLLGAARSQ